MVREKGCFMRRFGVLVGGRRLQEQLHIPDSRLVRTQPPLLVLLDERMREVFQHACLIGDLEAAGEVLALLCVWHARRTYENEQARLDDSRQVSRMRCELDRRHQERGTRPA